MTSKCAVAALAAATMVIGCGEKLPPGVNFVMSADRRIVINHQDAKWRIFLDGEDRTATTQFRHVPVAEGTEVPNILPTGVAFEFGGAPVLGLPNRFSLLPSNVPEHMCDECTPAQRLWSRK